MAKRKFKVSIFGYSRKVVNEYIATIDKSVKQEYSKRDAQTEMLKARVEELEEEKKNYEEKRIAIGNIIIEAKENAEKIRCEAEKEAENIISEARKKANDEIENAKKEILSKQRKAESEFCEIKEEIKERYEKELIKIKKQHSELKLLKTAASIILNNVNNDAFNSKRTIHKILNSNRANVSADVSFEELTQLL